ncbi:transcription/translation regulatory transformer protein RfaH, partial [Porticoccaceae bacterium]|nr:transcription/translation regulatory transformer protein RfaH [Porticoccaceae bacterium]
MDRWFLLQTKSRQESRAVENLERQGIDSFCPRINIEKILRGRRVVVDEALFPGYLFVSFNQQSVSATSVRSTRGVSNFVSCAGAPVLVPLELIESLKLREAEQSKMAEIAGALKAGDGLEILEGPFRGLNAVFSQPDGDSRAIVLINLLNQKVKAVLSFTSLQKLDSV